MNRLLRQHHERRVARRRDRKFGPGYVAKHEGKTPGKACSQPWCCGNPRSIEGPPACDRRRLQDRGVD